MPNSAADAGASELDIRRSLVEAGAVEAVYSIGPNFYQTGSNPVMIWFLRQPHAESEIELESMLFVDARRVKTEVSGALSTWTPAQCEYLANTARLYRGEKPETFAGSEALMSESFPGGSFLDVDGLCATVQISEVRDQEWSLNPGNFVSAAVSDQTDESFKERLSRLRIELEGLDGQAQRLRRRCKGTLDSLAGGGRG